MEQDADRRPAATARKAHLERLILVIGAPFLGVSAGSTATDSRSDVAGTLLSTASAAFLARSRRASARPAETGAFLYVAGQVSGQVRAMARAGRSCSCSRRGRGDKGHVTDRRTAFFRWNPAFLASSAATWVPGGARLHPASDGWGAHALECVPVGREESVSSGCCNVAASADTSAPTRSRWASPARHVRRRELWTKRAGGAALLEEARL